MILLSSSSPLSSSFETNMGNNDSTLSFFIAREKSFEGEKKIEKEETNVNETQ